jgi:pantoate--beta-alanine ligase
MGYLHAGHLSLVEASVKQCDITVVSIFVNPIQFGIGEDYEIYPRDTKRDETLLRDAKADVIFMPETAEMYPKWFNTFIEVEGDMVNKLCGASRPGHFKGVTTVVGKLFNICRPDYAYFGQKDAQQVTVIEKMVKELNFPVKIVRKPIVREDDGLAMSSRNVYLDKEQRSQALVLKKALDQAVEEIKSGVTDTNILKNNIIKTIKSSPMADIDYVSITGADDLKEIIKAEGKILIALAVKFGQTRLIDNFLVEV